MINKKVRLFFYQASSIPIKNILLKGTVHNRLEQERSTGKRKIEKNGGRENES
jgi:hypothetical protein